MPDPNVINKLFTPTQQQHIVARGSIIGFNYVGQTRHRIHDPYPLVIVSDVFNGMLRGCNLHFLTLPYVQGLVTNYGGKNFSYAFIKGDSYIVGAFRSYKTAGISQLRMLDTGFLRNLLTVVRALDPGEIEQMRSQVHEMLKNPVPQPIAQPGEEMRTSG